MRYSKKNDWVLDQFSGSGTTLVEAKLLGRNAIGTDINEKAIFISKHNLSFECGENSKIFVRRCDARSLNFLRNQSIDFICTHPPYADIIRYNTYNKADISILGYEDFLLEMDKVAKESYRVLKHEKVCAVMMGDIRKRGNVIPLGFKVMECFLNAGFKLKEIIIKEQHNCRTSKYWTGKNYGFLLIAHEYILVFEK